MFSLTKKIALSALVTTSLFSVSTSLAPATATTSVSHKSLSIICALPPSNDRAERHLTKSTTRSTTRMSYYAGKAASEYQEDMRRMTHKGFENYVLENARLYVQMKGNDNIVAIELDDTDKAVVFRPLEKENIKYTSRTETTTPHIPGRKRGLQLEQVTFAQKGHSLSRGTLRDIRRSQRTRFEYRFKAIDGSEDIFVFNKSPDFLEVKTRDKEPEGKYMSQLYMCIHEDEKLRDR